MNLDQLANVASAIVGVALVTTIVSSRNTAAIINAVGKAFASSLRAAQGKAG